MPEDNKENKRKEKDDSSTVLNNYYWQQREQLPTRVYILRFQTSLKNKKK